MQVFYLISTSLPLMVINQIDKTIFAHYCNIVTSFPVTRCHLGRNRIVVDLYLPQQLLYIINKVVI